MEVAKAVLVSEGSEISGDVKKTVPRHSYILLERKGLKQQH